jgi:hypothetical protein
MTAVSAQENSKMLFRKAIPVALLLAAACGGSSSPSITAPAITQAPVGATAAAGGTASFSVVASGTGLSYQWSRGGAAISGASAASYTTPALTAADDGASFTVAVSNGGGSVVSAPATLHVNFVHIDTHPQSTGVTSGSAATLTVAASGSGTLSYQWKKDGTAVSGATAASFHLGTALTTDAGNYTCVVTSTLSGTTVSAESNAAALVVMVAPQISAQPHALTVAAGNAASFSVTASSADPLSYQWWKGNVAIAGATSATYTIPSAAGADAASYSVVVTGTHGAFSSTTNSNPAALTVVSPPTLAALSDKLVAEGGALTLNASATAAPGMPNSTYQWSKDGTNLPGATTNTFSVAAMTSANTGVYTLTASATLNGVTASTTSTSTVSMVAKPIVTSQPTGTTINAGGSFSVSVAASGPDAITYQWTLNGTPVAGATASTYSVGSAGATDAGNYVCVVSKTRQGVSASAASSAAMVTVNARPVITTQPASITVQESQTATFTVVAAGSGLTYQWFRGVPPTGGTAIPGATSPTYTTAPTDITVDNGATFYCVIDNGFPPPETTNAATLTVVPAPPQFDATVTTLALGEGAVLRWNFVGTATLQQGTSTPVAVTTGGSTVVFPSATKTYTLSVTNHGVTQTATVTITVKTYTPKNMYVLNAYPTQTPAAPADSIAHFTIGVVHGTLGSPDTYQPPGAANGARPANTNPTGAFPIHVVASPDESHLYVANNNDSTISAFTIAAVGGNLTEVAGSPFAIVGDVQPFASALDVTGAHLYVGCNDGVRVFDVSATTGALTAHPTLDQPIPGRVEGDVLMHPSGRWLYVADHGHDAIQVYSVNPTTGALTFVAAAPSAGSPTGLTFDRAASRIFSRGTDATPVPNTTPPATFNAQIHVFAIDAFSGTLTETSTYHGYGPNPILEQMQAGAQMPFVPGVDSHLHGLAFSKRPGVDALYDAYSQDLSVPGNEGFSWSSYDVSATGVSGDRTEGFMGSPFVIDAFNWQSEGGSIFLDRSGSALVVTQWISRVIGINECVYYPTDPSTGTVLAISGVSAFNIEYTLNAGAQSFLVNQTHGAFTGLLQ